MKTSPTQRANSSCRRRSRPAVRWDEDPREAGFLPVFSLSTIILAIFILIGLSCSNCGRKATKTVLLESLHKPDTVAFDPMDSAYLRKTFPPPRPAEPYVPKPNKDGYVQEKRYEGPWYNYWQYPDTFVTLHGKKLKFTQSSFEGVFHYGHSEGDGLNKRYWDLHYPGVLVREESFGEGVYPYAHMVQFVEFYNRDLELIKKIDLLSINPWKERMGDRHDKHLAHLPTYFEFK